MISSVSPLHCCTKHWVLMTFGLSRFCWFYRRLSGLQNPCERLNMLQVDYTEICQSLHTKNKICTTQLPLLLSQAPNSVQQRGGETPPFDHNQAHERLNMLQVDSTQKYDKICKQKVKSAQPNCHYCSVRLLTPCSSVVVKRRRS